QGISGSVDLWIEGDDDTINVGNNGRVQDIRGTLFVRGGLDAERVTLNVDDSANVAARNTTLRTGNAGVTSIIGVLEGLAPGTIQYEGVYSLQVFGGSGGNVFLVSNTVETSFTHIATGSGNDRVIVQQTSGPLTIDGVDGFDTITVGQGSSLSG